jgi:lipopolysaccharide transport system permease protein
VNRYISDFSQFIGELFTKRQLLMELISRDIRARYLGSALGLFWAYIHPSLSILVLIAVFQFGFKAQPVADAPFIIWFVTAMIPWLFISESISSATHGVVDYSYLVKKVAFRTALLPLVKIISALFVNVFFVSALFVLCWVYKYPISIYSLQVPYYLFCSIFLVVGISWITSSVMVFFKDVGQVVAATLSFFFWLTPLTWNYHILPERYQHWLSLNPVFYILQGYRRSFIEQTWFWEPQMLLPTALFWIISGSIFFIGALVFRRLRPHFADVI